MMFLLIIAIIIALFFAMNIGASGTAASMAAPYGGGAIKKRWVALILVSISAFLGAFSGGEVVKTIGEGIIPSDILSVEIIIIILGAACLTLFFANVLGIPLSTSEVTVGSVIGVGIAYQSLFAGKILFIFSVWIILPFVAFGAAYLLAKILQKVEIKFSVLINHRAQKTLGVLLIITGCYEAFAAGMNNVANAVGPLVGAGLIEINIAIIFGGLFVALGALMLGGKVLETNAKKITDISLLQGSIVSFTSGTLVFIASVFGLPVPLTQATTMAIFGISASKNNKELWKSAVVKRIIKIWIISPVSSMVLSYLLVEVAIKKNLYGIIIVVGSVIMSVGYMSFLNATRKKVIKY